MITIILLTIAAFFAGLIDAAAGGGGLITLPALLAAGVPAHMALGTNKLQSACGTTFALANFARKAKVVWKVAAVGIPFALLGSIAGAKSALMVSPRELTRAIIVVIPLVAVSIYILKPMLLKPNEEERSKFSLWLVTPLVCLLIGFYDGIFGPGTGTFLIIALALFTRLPLLQASATAKTFNLASNVGALAMFVISASVIYAYAIPMAIANIAGNFAGSHMAMRRGNAFIHKLLFVSLTLLIAYLAWKYSR